MASTSAWISTVMLSPRAFVNVDSSSPRMLSRSSGNYIERVEGVWVDGLCVFCIWNRGEIIDNGYMLPSIPSHTSSTSLFPFLVATIK